VKDECCTGFKLHCGTALTKAGRADAFTVPNGTAGILEFAQCLKQEPVIRSLTLSGTLGKNTQALVSIIPVLPSESFKQAASRRSDVFTSNLRLICHSMSFAFGHVSTQDFTVNLRPIDPGIGVEPSESVFVGGFNTICHVTSVPRRRTNVTYSRHRF